MIRIDIRSGIPLHEQVKSGIRELIVKGLLKPGDPVTPATNLAEQLLISPQSVSRAYRELGKEGVLRFSTKGAFVSAEGLKEANQGLTDVLQQFLESLQQAQRSGLSLEDIRAIVEFIKADGRLRASDPAAIPAILRRLYFDGAATPTGMPVCPYCRETIQQGAAVSACVLCKTAHHPECWNEVTHCSVFGCQGRVALS